MTSVFACLLGYYSMWQVHVTRCLGSFSCFSFLFLFPCFFVFFFSVDSAFPNSLSRSLKPPFFSWSLFFLLLNLYPDPVVFFKDYRSIPAVFFWPFAIPHFEDLAMSSLLTSVKAFFTRHRRKIFVSLGLFASGYFAIDYLKNKLFEIQDRLATERSAKEKYVVYYYYYYYHLFLHLY